MFEPKLTDPHPEAAKNLSAKSVLQAKELRSRRRCRQLPFSEEGWSDWRIIDCSRLPGGALSCGWIAYRR
jgi:hypothetical protein